MSPVRPPSEKTLVTMLVALLAVLGVLASGSAGAGPAPAPAVPAAAPVTAPPVEPAAVVAPAVVPAAAPAVPAAAPVPPAAAPPAAPALAAGTPCSSTADACVDLSEQRAWLLDGAGNVTYGPVGALGGTRKDPTPTGVFSVDYKDKDHRSNLYDADMPNSVFFAPAIAFHRGSLSDRSHGCIHLGGTASQRFFSELSPGDTVQVVS